MLQASVHAGKDTQGVVTKEIVLKVIDLIAARGSCGNGKILKIHYLEFSSFLI